MVKNIKKDKYRDENRKIKQQGIRNKKIKKHEKEKMKRE